MSEIEKYTESIVFETISKEQLAKISSRFPEFYRASKIIGHSTSQASYTLQTLHMISDSPFSRMKQCISQINKKKLAFNEAYFKVEKMKLKTEELYKKDQNFLSFIKFKKISKLEKLEIKENEELINTISISMENALRQIGMFQDMYESIRKSNDIPEDWTEKDYEEQEIGNMIKSSFRIAIQDLSMTGSVSKAAVEFWEQLGIHPQFAETITRGYRMKIDADIKNGKKIEITEMYNFLDDMVKEFKDSNKLALERMGLKGIGSEQFMANGVTKPK